MDFATLTDFDAPSYSQDTQDGVGIPAGPALLRQQLEATDAFVIVSPEYNASLPGGLKNAIDWVSRYRPQPFHQRHGLVMSASPSMVGGNRGLWALRVPLEHLGARIYPDMFLFAQAHQGFDESSQIASPQLAEFFETTIVGFLDLAEASSSSQKQLGSTHDSTVALSDRLARPGPPARSEATQQAIGCPVCAVLQHA